VSAYEQQHQTTFGGETAPPEQRGNCYAACIAMLLGIDVALVPNFVAAEDHVEAAAAWLSERGVLLWCFPSDPLEPVPEWRSRATMIASGMTPRGHMHAVLWRDGELLLDPHPSGIGLSGEPETYEVLVIADPACFRRWLADAEMSRRRGS